MKGTLLRLLAGTVLVFVLFATPGSVSASVTAITEGDLAREAGQVWLEVMASHVSDLPEWDNARVVSPQAYYSLENDISAYQFSIVNGTKVVGSMLVGIFSYEFHVLRANEVQPPAIPTPEEVKFALANLGFKVDSADFREPIRLVYTGVDGQYALYKIADQTIAVNLFTKKAVPFSDLTPKIPPRKEPTNLKKAVAGSDYSTKSTGYYYLSMSAYQYGYCGPASGVSIARYYRDVEGYSSLYSDANLYAWFYSEMDCAYWGGATLPGCYGTGFEATTEQCGYYNFGYTNDWWVTQDDYWTVVSNINSGWPTALCLTGDWHWRAIKGYDYVTDPYNWYYIICTNSQNGANFEYLEWGPDVVYDYYAFMTSIND